MMWEEVIALSIALILIAFGLFIYWIWHTIWSTWLILIGILIMMGVIVAMVVSYQREQQD